MHRHFCRISLILGLLASPSIAQAQAPASRTVLAERQRKIMATIEKVAPAVVAVTDGEGWGSGVIVSDEGLILSAAHVTMHARRMEVILPDGRRLQAASLGRNLNNDAGLIKLASDSDNGKPWPSVRLGTVSGLKRGDWTITLGHPGGLEPNRPAPVRVGRVLSVGARTIVTDGTIIVGDSGGPVFDLDARLVGIHSMIGSDITNNRHVSIDVIRRDWPRLLGGETWGELGDFDTGLARSSYFGTDLVWEDYEARVRRVRPDSPASAAGLRPGDRLVSIDGQAIADTLELSLILGERQPGDQIPVIVRRGRKRVELTVQLGSWPETSLDDEPMVAARKGPGRFEKAGNLALAEFRPATEPTHGSTVRLLDAADPTAQLALGTVVSRDGYIATKHSEIDDAATLLVELESGDRLPGRLVSFDERFDLAIVRVDRRDLRPVRWQADPPQVGQLLVSPDFSAEPAAIGVVSVPVRELDETAFLGVRPATHPRGAQIAEVIEDSAAERAGLQSRDIIRAINQRRVSGSQDLIRRIAQFRPGDVIRMEIERPLGRRRSEIRDFEVALSSRFVAGDWRRQFEENNLMGTPLSKHASGFPVVLQHDTVLRPNQCGGPLLNIDGQAVGINIARAGRVMSYAIPAPEARRLIRTLVENAEEPVGRAG